MKKRLLLIFLLAGFLKSFAQDLPSMEQMLHAYRNAIDAFQTNQGCGHVLDGPLAFGKELERSSLDLLIQVSPDEEKTMGKEVNAKMREELTVVPDHWAQADLNNMIRKLSGRLKRSYVAYKAIVFQSEEVNAFATVGGYIYITTGLLDFVESMDELAFIVAHEISHNDLEHTLRKQKKLLMASNLGRMINMETLTTVALNINLMLSAPFDQIDEYAADRNAFDLALRAGYDKNRFDDFFIKLEQYEQPGLLTKLLSTHPFPSDRKNCIQQYIDNSK